MGKKIWLSMHPINFGSKKIVRTRQYVRIPLHVSRGGILHFKHPPVSEVNRRTPRNKKKTTTTKPILSFDLILMSTLTLITEKNTNIL